MMGALLIGFVGSLHCAGMCGPLMITFTSRNGLQSVYSFLLYHLGRIMTYGIMGLCVGAIGQTLFDYQKHVSLVVGVMIILIYTVPRSRKWLEGYYYRSAFYRRVKQLFSGFYGTRLRWLSAGMLNGFLPCGLIYLAVAGAMIAGGTTSAILFMVLFGVGTLPALAGVAFFQKNIPTVFGNLSRLTPIVAVMAGSILIFRGLLIDSPQMSHLISLQISNFITACGW